MRDNAESLSQILRSIDRSVGKEILIILGTVTNIGETKNMMRNRDEKPGTFTILRNR